MKLAGQVALVTGASRGIGRAVALRLAREGAAVCVNYATRRSEATAVVAEIQRLELLPGARGPVPRALAYGADVADPDQAAGLVQATVARWGRLDIVVNNAGVALDKLLLDTTPAEWDQVLAVHLRGAFNCSKAALPHLLVAGGGRIINISSIWGLVGAAGEVAYSTAKAGLIGFTRALARELGRAAITVNAVAPGVVATEMIGHLSEEDVHELAAQTPTGRIGSPEDVAEAVAFLCWPESAYITGQVLSPNGGLVM